MSTYFRINNALICGKRDQILEFADGVQIGENIYDIMPASVTPSHEIIKNAERSLDGTMSVDIIDVKTTLTLTFGVLENKDFRFVTEIFNLKNQHNIYPDGIDADYFDIKDSGALKNIVCYIDAMEYLPYITENGIKWRDLKLTLIEI